jgi:hypothetical protein
VVSILLHHLNSFSKILDLTWIYFHRYFLTLSNPHPVPSSFVRPTTPTLPRHHRTQGNALVLYVCTYIQGNKGRPPTADLPPHPLDWIFRCANQKPAARRATFLSATIPTIPGPRQSAAVATITSTATAARCASAFQVPRQIAGTLEARAISSCCLGLAACVCVRLCSAWLPCPCLALVAPPGLLLHSQSPLPQRAPTTIIISRHVVSQTQRRGQRRRSSCTLPSQTAPTVEQSIPQRSTRVRHLALSCVLILLVSFRFVPASCFVARLLVSL